MKTLIAYLQLFPTVILAVQSLEGAIPLPSTGKQKLDLLLGIVKTVYDTEESVRKDVPWTQLEGLIRTAASAIVTAFNSLGLFQHPAAH